MARSLEFFKGRTNYTEIMGLSAVRRLPRIGKLHLGIKVPSAKNEKCRKENHPNEPMCPYCSYPKDTDYFVLEKGMDGKLREKFVSVYGETPQSIDIYFPTADRSLVFPQALMCYKGMKLWCRGDGKTASRIDESSGSMKRVACSCEHLTGVKEDGTPWADEKGKPYTTDCRFRAKLMVLLPKVTMAGIWQIDSGSSNNIIEINSALDYYQVLLRRIAFVPFILKRVPTVIQTPDNKAVTKALLKLEFEGDEKEVAAFRQKDAIGRLLPGDQTQAVAALPPPPDTDIEEVEEAFEVNGVQVTPPDQALLPENVNPATGKVRDSSPEDKGGVTGDPEKGGLPFGPKEESPKWPWQAKPPKDPSDIIVAVGQIKSREEWLAFRAHADPIIEKMKSGIKAGVEKFIADKEAEFI